ncbi:MAG TPA: NAD-dependent epimerase/dehydratase family protein [Solirubrobacterales bacterium]|nr:NAD-dependent epimerase/dehydratase family protein [Solirubrobacterales bacterium]
MAGPRILVVGCGFIGSHVVAELVGRGQPPAVLTRSEPQPALATAGLRPRIGDAASRAVVDAVLEDVEHVVYSAGGLLPAASEEDPERDAELTLAPIRTVLAALRERPGVGLTYLSSGGTVYGEPETVPVPEDAPANPIGAYGRLHLECEDEVLREQREHGLAVRILRCASVYGPYQEPDRGQGAATTFLHRIEAGLPIDLYGDGKSERDYVYAGDVAGVVAELAGREDGPAVLNVGSGEGTSLLDLLRAAEREVGRPAEVVTHPARGFEVRRVVLDVARLRALTGFEPTPLAEGIAHTHEWLSATARQRV